jgi:hypothetical protein
VIIVDLDDFADNRASLEAIVLLDDIQQLVPTFKATLFTIPARVTREFVVWIKRTRPWLELAGHGWAHTVNVETKYWSELQMLDCLDWTINRGIEARGWKAPGWQISAGCYDALTKRGYWVADQTYNDSRRPKDLPAYCITERNEPSIRGRDIATYYGDRAIHGHIGHLNGRNANALDLIYDTIVSAGSSDRDFRFISEIVQWQ